MQITHRQFRYGFLVGILFAFTAHLALMIFPPYGPIVHMIAIIFLLQYGLSRQAPARRENR